MSEAPSSVTPASGAAVPILTIKDLIVSYRTGHRQIEALKGVSLTLHPREVVAIVGESGSGKSTLANAIIATLPVNAKLRSGSVSFNGLPISSYSHRQMRQIRGRRIGVVPQDPMTSLNPTQRIEQQVAEPLLLHRLANASTVKEKVRDLLVQAGLPDPERIAGSYPHELSGGMKQRVLIAIAFACGPELIIADEPTSALDVTVAKRVMDHFSRLVAESHTAMIVITHDIALAIHRADRILVMKNGAIVESATVRELQRQPKSHYARELLTNAPRLYRRPIAEIVETAEPARDEAPALLKVEKISKRFTLPHRDVVAVDDVSFEIKQGKTLALVGESGSGKSTTARLVLRLESMSTGSIRFRDAEIGTLHGEDLRQMRRNMQVVYQSPYESLNPRMRIAQIVVEPLRAFGVGTARERDARAAELLDLVGLPKSFLGRRPAELSGGQQQRVAIARALALSPQLVVCDEPVSALDVLVQAQVLRLLKSLQRDLGVAYLFISHDLSIVQDFADSVAVMSKGRVVEAGPTSRVFAQPQHDYTRTLLSSAAEL
jgi:peptide/nickel transport system ATP-binding protein